MSNSSDSRPDFFSYVDDSLTGSISQAVRRNDKNTLLRMLKKRKKNPLPLPADNRGWTALHIAASQPQYKECLELLLRYGDSILINLDDTTFQQETALHIACENGCDENVLLLLQNGCDPKLKTIECDSALHIAASKGHSKIVEYLLRYPININEQDWQKYTPLHLAAANGYFKICCDLLGKGANVQSIDFDGNSPLHLACQNGNADIARLFLQHNSTSINFQNCDGITPFMLSVRSFDAPEVRHFLENEAKTNICDWKGRTALHFAAIGGKAEVLKLVLLSTDVELIEGCLFDFLEIGRTRRTIYSLMCCAIHSASVDCLTVLITSELPKSILQAPYVENHDTSIRVYSPLAYVFSWLAGSRDDELNSCLLLLLKHKITMLDEFHKVVPVKWPHPGVKFVNPISEVFCDSWSFIQQRHYFNLLIANDITTDYCLQCYYDNAEPFATFTAYDLYYEAVIDAVRKSNTEIMKLLLSNSVIIEPDELLIRYFIVRPTSITMELQDTRNMYQYLTSLKPIYYSKKLVQQCKLHIFRLYINYTPNEEFTKATLQQLCRTVIRQQLRERTLEDNIRNFKSKISELPLPDSLKDYLLFKN